eukprot:365333-Chlamydomonas_euryale.AAC.21
MDAQVVYLQRAVQKRATDGGISLQMRGATLFAPRAQFVQHRSVSSIPTCTCHCHLERFTIPKAKCLHSHAEPSLHQYVHRNHSLLRAPATPTSRLDFSTPRDTLLTASRGTTCGFHIQCAPSTTSVSPVTKLWRGLGRRHRE